MKENFKPILEAFENAGIEVSKAEFSITEYSLNTNLSFRFHNIDEFLDFLKLNSHEANDRTEEINNALVQSGINPSDVFYVNFFSPKVAEL